jgi:hypothetical protein
MCSDCLARGRYFGVWRQRMATRKDRLQDGYVTPQATISKKELIENDLFIDDFYDDWEDYRDGFRDWFGDFKKIKNVKDKWWDKRCLKRVQMNRKQELFLKRRNARALAAKNRLNWGFGHAASHLTQ